MPVWEWRRDIVETEKEKHKSFICKNASLVNEWKTEYYQAYQATIQWRGFILKKLIWMFHVQMTIKGNKENKDEDVWCQNWRQKTDKKIHCKYCDNYSRNKETASSNTETPLFRSQREKNTEHPVLKLGVFVPLEGFQSNP